jgi:hypothetical protein
MTGRSEWVNHERRGTYNRGMDRESQSGRLRSFLIGGLVGASAVLAAARRKRPRRRQTPPGLAAFEDAPCYRETLERERGS